MAVEENPGNELLAEALEAAEARRDARLADKEKAVEALAEKSDAEAAAKEKTHAAAVVRSRAEANAAHADAAGGRAGLESPSTFPGAQRIDGTSPLPEDMPQ